MKPPSILCPRLPAFDWKNLESVKQTFRDLSAIPMHQSWLSSEEPDFVPASVQVGWRDESLFAFATFTDVDISTRATAHNQRMWELGDVFEIFLRPEHQKAYLEFHVTPNNYRLQLRFADAEALEYISRTGSIDRVLIPGQAFDSAVWLQPEIQRWQVCVKIPTASVCDQKSALPGSRWYFSFCRYDYTAGRSQPVISSTSPHKAANFHSKEEWRLLQFAR